MHDQRITVAGGGSWGTALANHLAKKGFDVRLWLRSEDLARTINTQHENTRYLPGISLHPNLVATKDPSVLTSPVLVLSIPCQQLAAFLAYAEPFLLPHVLLLNTAKGIEISTRRLCSQIVEDEVSIPHTYAVLSGPSFAKEVLRSLPTAVVIASKNSAKAMDLLSLFSNAHFRCYFSDDVVGAEAGGALKNIMAIACGICDSLNLGANSRAALITRGLAEIERIGVALGAKPGTFKGLSGMGDLVLTCVGDLSRNRQVGLAVGQGKSLEETIRELGMVAEGVGTCRAVHTLISEKNIDAPICNAVYTILEYGKNPLDVLQELMQRSLHYE